MQIKNGLIMCRVEMWYKKRVAKNINRLIDIAWILFKISHKTSFWFHAAK